MYFDEAEYTTFTLDDFAVLEVNSLNHKSGYKATKKLSEMEIGLKYNIHSLRKVNTRWGERLVADLGEYTVG